MPNLIHMVSYIVGGGGVLGLGYHLTRIIYRFGSVTLSAYKLAALFTEEEEKTIVSDINGMPSSSTETETKTVSAASANSVTFVPQAIKTVEEALTLVPDLVTVLDDIMPVYAAYKSGDFITVLKDAEGAKTAILKLINDARKI